MLTLSNLYAKGDGYTISGKITINKKGEPAMYATVMVEESGLWTLTDKNGNYSIKGIDKGKYTLKVEMDGYVSTTKSVEVSRSLSDINFSLVRRTLKINEVTINATRQKSESSTSYIIEKTALDHLLPLNLNDITSLLPGGKLQGDHNLASSDTRFALRSGGNSGGNVSFGTAIEIDGVRLSNNSSFSEVMGVSTRNVSLEDISSVEVVTGIASVEYGDLSNGIIKVTSNKGKSDLRVSVTIKPNTKQFSFGNGFVLGENAGILNVSAEHTRSISNLVSPYTAYDRNGASLNYINRLNSVTLTAGLSGNIGGYDSKADPDQLTGTYTKQSDNALRVRFGVDWQPNLKWLSVVDFDTSLSYSDNLQETRTNENSAATTVALHTLETGYFVGQYYDVDPNAPITLIRPGQWYEINYTDSKQLNYNAKLRAKHNHNINDNIFNSILVGGEYSLSGNLGQGNYYQDIATAPTWREFVLSEQPFVNNLSFYAEDKLRWTVKDNTYLTLTAGVRSDITHINGSQYGTAMNLSPRFNARYDVGKFNNSDISRLSIYGGWGRSVKLPAAGVLYPTANYIDRLAFVTASNDRGEAYYAYYTDVVYPLHNSNLEWLYSDQIEIGGELKYKGHTFSLSLYHSKTMNQYITATKYNPYSYKLTTQDHLENVSIPSDNRVYSIDQTTGIVTVSDKSGVLPSEELSYKENNTFLSQSMPDNGSEVNRYGVEYVLDFAKIKALRTSIRVDGNFTYYKGYSDRMTQGRPNSTITMQSGIPYQYIGHYYGGSSVANGTIDKELNTNVTFTTHIPEVRMIFSLRFESTLLSYSQSISEREGGAPRGYVLGTSTDLIGEIGDIYTGNNYIAHYPDYYSTWDNPNEMIPYLETLMWAKDNDTELYYDLAHLITKSNTTRSLTPQTVTPYFSFNLSVTKEFGDFASMTFYTTNFLNNMAKVKHSWYETETSLYGTGYIPRFYYGLSLRLKF